MSSENEKKSNSLSHKMNDESNFTILSLFLGYSSKNVEHVKRHDTFFGREVAIKNVERAHRDWMKSNRTTTEEEKKHERNKALQEKANS